MPRRKATDPEDLPTVAMPGTTPDEREQQLIALAVNLAEKQMREGTASSQVISHYLKLGSSSERLAQQKLALETKLVEAKTEQIASQQRTEELYRQAMLSMRAYSGQGPHPDEMEPEDHAPDVL